MDQSSIILFDGICNLCCGWVQFLIRKDKKRRFRFASIQSVRGESLLNSLGISSRNMETVYYLKGGRCYRESTAVLEILKDLGGIWGLFAIFKLIPSVLRDKTYRYISKKRYVFFGKRTTCYLPTQENKKIFLT